MSTPTFEERFGLPKKGLQVNSIDAKTRMRVWNELDQILFYNIYSSKNNTIGIPRSGMFYDYTYSLWSDLLGWESSTIPATKSGLIPAFKGYLLRKDLPWFDFLKFVEKALTNYLDTLKSYGSGLIEDPAFEKYTQRVNKIFAEESCGYRFLGNYLAPIIDEIELNEVADALARTDSISSVKSHLKNALMLLSDRERPDYNNSVKESISAMEALFRLIAQKPNATLSQVIEDVEKKTGIHTKLKMAIKYLYDWTSDASGVRHAKKGDATENFDSAKLALVTCSGLVNYLLAKSQEAGLTLKE
ncbi:AbiJ-NTD4 domain-containing protein [Spirosoma panaciterrae]|uniref:AbiJ-NTD4 domain-containing protein n=1 Tax=Spirosoma panaciterrae TaxID=496058 RepID=UPI00037B67AB|nr:hypothetical protein [Spirosoma panaciterrae]